MDTTELRRKRAMLVKQARELLDKAETEKRSLSAEDEQQYDRIMAEVDSLGKQIEREERTQALERELEGSQGRQAGGREQPGGPGDNRTAAPQATEEYRAAFRGFLRGGLAGLRSEEARALQATDATAGGYILAPQQFVTDLIKGINDLMAIRRLATVVTLDRADSLGAASLDADPADADWTSEIGTGNEDTAMKFGRRDLKPHPLAKRIKISNKLLRNAVIDPEALVRDRLAYKFAVPEEKAFLTGSGVEQPLGLFTASPMGISTGRDVVGGTATDITADALMDVKYALKPQYWARARWLFHRDALKRIRKLKDTANQYLWQPGLAAGQPNTLLDSPYELSEFAPNTFTTGQYVAMYGDFKFYWIADALDMQFQRLVELYAETNQVGFIGRKETDGMPVLEEAFIRAKLA